MDVDSYMHIFLYPCLFQMLLNVKESFVYS